MKIGFETIAEKSYQKTLEAQSLMNHEGIVKVSYSDKSFTQEKIGSALITSNLESERLFIGPELERDVHYSYQNDLIEAGKRIESVLVYGHEDTSIPMIIHSVKSVYKDYPKAFKHKDAVIPAYLMDRLVKENSHTSYSRMNDYFQCEFKYLLKSVLKVKEPDTNPQPRLVGDFFHEVLSQLNDLPDDEAERHSVYESIVKKSEQKNEIISSPEDTFYIRYLFDHLDAFVDYVKSFHESSDFEIFGLEKEYEVPIKGKKINRVIGFVDKIMSYQNHFAIIDYKSSAHRINLVKLEKGLGSQLPFYMNVVKNNTPGLDTPVALFYHPFSMSVHKSDKNKDISSQQKEDWKMDGYIDEAWADVFDPLNITNGFVKGLKKTQKLEFYATAPLLSTEKLSALGQYIENLVNTSVLQIEAGRFKINPKGDSLDTSESCRYCKFKDVCYRTPDDLEDFSFETPNEFMDSIVGGLDDTQ